MTGDDRFIRPWCRNHPRDVLGGSTVLTHGTTRRCAAHAVVLRTVSCCARCRAAHGVVLRAVSCCARCRAAHGVVLRTVSCPYAVVASKVVLVAMSA